MQKLTVKYFAWKLLIYALLALMVLPLAFPAALIVRRTEAGPLAVKILATASFIVFLLFQRWLMGRSDLSRIKASTYLLGEAGVYAFLALIGGTVLVLVSRGLAPLLPETALFYLYVPFFPLIAASFWCENAALGFLVQIALYPLAVFLFYLLKKRKNPALTPAGRAQGKEAIETSFGAEDGETPGEEEDAPAHREEDAP